MPQYISSNVSVNAAGSRVPMHVDPQGALNVSALGGSKYAPTRAKATYSGANQTGATLSAALATGYTGLCLSNPAASTKQLVVRRVAGVLGVAPAAGLTLGLISGFAAGGITVHTTPVAVIRSGFVGDATVALGKLDAACTLVGTPAWVQWLKGNAAAVAGDMSFSIDFEAGIVIPAGGYLAIGGNVAGPAAGFFGSMEWEELAV